MPWMLETSKEIYSPVSPGAFYFIPKGCKHPRTFLSSPREDLFVRNLMSFPLSGGKGGLLCSRFCVNSKILNLWVFFCHRDSPFSLITSPQGREGGMKNYMVIALNNNDLWPRNLEFSYLVLKTYHCLSFVDIKSYTDLKRGVGFSLLLITVF